MGAPKLRIVFYADKNEVQSYSHLEKTEAMRIIAILKILPKLKKWTPVSAISKMIDAKVPAVLSTMYKLAGALRIDLKLPEGRKTVAKKPVLYIRKEQHNTRSNLTSQKYLRATVYIKAHIRK